MIYVECSPDEALVRITAGLPKRDIIHEQGKFEVLRRLARSQGLQAMLDEDPASIMPSTLKRMRVEQELNEAALRLMLDPRKSNRVILLCPRLEEWVIGAAREGQKNIEDYGLPR